DGSAPWLATPAVRVAAFRFPGRHLVRGWGDWPGRCNHRGPNTHNAGHRHE
ncbi:MAG: hypothetical protein AVDCRST_MAG87-496, partial [uncultured Thermomicrobiales bacterium]